MLDLSDLFIKEIFDLPKVVTEDLISTPMEKEAGLTTIQKLSSEFWISGANVIKMTFCH